jgi:hypothetical protein
MSRVNVDRMRRYNQGGRAGKALTQPFPVTDWYRTERTDELPAGVAARYIPGVSP